MGGMSIHCTRWFSPGPTIGGTVEAAIRALVFQPRSNVSIGTTETTVFYVLVQDGCGAKITNTMTSIITTCVAPRSTASTAAAAALFLDSDINTVVVPAVTKSGADPLARLVKRGRSAPRRIHRDVNHNTEGHPVDDLVLDFDSHSTRWTHSSVNSITMVKCSMRLPALQATPQFQSSRTALRDPVGRHSSTMCV